MKDTKEREEKLGLLIKDKFYPGLVVKNYNELCSLLNLSNNGGTQKVANLKKIQKFCSYDRKGYKFIINEVFEEPKEEKQRIGNNAKYIPLIETLLLNEFIKRDKIVLDMTKRELWECLGMVNRNYNSNYHRKKEFLMELQQVDSRVKQWHVNNAYLNSKNKLNQITKSALNSLRNRKLIEYYDNIIIAYEKGHYKEITDSNEIAIIIKCEKKALEQLNCKNFNQVIFNSNKNINLRRYNNIVNNELYEKLGYDFIFRKYRIICNDEYLLEGLEENINQLKKLLNGKIIDFLVNRSEKDLAKNKEDVKNKKTSFRYNNAYVDIQKFILTKLLNIDEKDINDFIKNLEEDSEVTGTAFSIDWI